MFKKLVANDSAVKTLFDHFKNMAVVAAIFSAAVFTYSQPPSHTLFFIYTRHAATIALVALGIFLFIVNERHGHKKLKEAGLSSSIQLLSSMIYGLSIFSFVFALTGIKAN